MKIHHMTNLSSSGFLVLLLGSLTTFSIFSIDGSPERSESTRSEADRPTVLSTSAEVGKPARNVDIGDALPLTRSFDEVDLSCANEDQTVLIGEALERSSLERLVDWTQDSWTSYKFTKTCEGAVLLLMFVELAIASF